MSPISQHYLAAQLSQITMLHASSDISLWVHLEIPTCAPIPVSALLWLPSISCPPSLNPLMTHNLRLWDLVRYSGDLLSPFLQLLPLQNNPLFPPQLSKLNLESDWLPCTPTPNFELSNFIKLTPIYSQVISMTYKQFRM